VYIIRGGDMIQVYKILLGFEDIPENLLLKLAGEKITRGRSQLKATQT
jgi:hypothetical protein